MPLTRRPFKIILRAECFGHLAAARSWREDFARPGQSRITRDWVKEQHLFNLNRSKRQDQRARELGVRLP